MENPYEILGVRPDNSEATIRAAYRKLAKRYHPDLNPGKPEALERFKKINSANELLSDPDKRGKFDRGEIDAEGNEKRPERPSYQDFTAGSDRYGGQGINPEDLEDLFGQAFGDRFGGRRGPGFRQRGRDAHYGLTVDFMDAAIGAVRRLTLPDGRTLDVTIPPGLRDGHVLRLKGQGDPGFGGDAAGDALVEISVAPHRFFTRDGNDILMELPVTLQEAVLGAAIEVPTLRGRVRVTVPPNSDTGTKLRLAGRGIAGGNQVIVLRVRLPPEPEPELAAFLKDWKPAHGFNPRQGMEDA